MITTAFHWIVPPIHIEKTITGQMDNHLLEAALTIAQRHCESQREVILKT